MAVGIDHVLRWRLRRQPEGLWLVGVEWYVGNGWCVHFGRWRFDRDEDSPTPSGTGEA